MYLLRLMLVGVWLGLLWVLFYFFDHYIQSSVTRLQRLQCTVGKRRMLYELSPVVFVYYLVPPFREHLRTLVRHSSYSYV